MWRLQWPAIDLFGTTASRKGRALAFESSCPTPALVRGDAVRLQQILSNLLSNAIKFTERGQISVRLASQQASGGARYQFTVTDTGIGLEADQIDHLFAPFVQAEVTTSRRYGGTGLGLAISRRLVEAMGGQLEVVSTPGQGSTFTFDITLPEGQSVQQARSRPLRDAPRAPSLDVLVAEDNPISQMLVAALVRRMGHRVTVVANGRDAVEAAAAHRFDAILMDMQMPELDGLAATRAIRSSGGPCVAIPIFALTADASAERWRFYDGAGLTDFLTKPIDRAALAARLALIDRPAPPVHEGLKAVATVAAGLFEAERVDELRSALGSYRFDALLALLIAECRDRPARLRAALRRNDLAALHAEVHSLKGAATSIRAAALGAVARRFEQVTSIIAAQRLVEELETTARATLAAAEHLISQPPGDRATA